VVLIYYWDIARQEAADSTLVRRFICDRLRLPAPRIPQMPVRYRRSLRIALIGGGLLVCLIAAALLAVPLLLDLPSVSAAIQRQLAQSIGGQIAWDTMQVRLLPTPRVVLRGAHVNLPGRAKIDMEQAHVHLRLSALFRGHTQIAALTLHKPVFDIEAPASPAKPDATPADPLAAYRTAMSPAIESVRKIASDSVLAIEAGSGELRIAGMPALVLRDLFMRVHVGVQAVDFDIATSGSLWSSLVASGQVVLADLSAHGKLEVKQLQPNAWLERWAAGVSLPSADLRVRARTDAKTSIQTEIELSAPSLQIVRHTRPLQISETELMASMTTGTQTTQVEWSQLRLSPLLAASRGTLNIGNDGQHPHLAVEIPQLDLAALCDAALAFAADDPSVAEYAPRVHAGQITQARIASQADHWSELLDADHLDLRFALANAAARVPGVEQDATSISAQVELKNARLHATSIGARLADSTLTNGSVTHTAKERSTSFEVEFDVQAAQALEMARRFSPRNAPDRLSEIASATGHLSGRASASTARDGWNAIVDIARSDVSLRAKQLPWPIRLHTARVSASAARLGVTGLSGSFGRSTVEQVALEVALRPDAALTAATGRALLALDELYPWLRTQRVLADGLRDLTGVSGTAQIEVNRLAGRLDRPARLNYDITVLPKQISLLHRELPAPLVLDGGSVRLDSSTLRFERVAVAMLDARAVLTAAIDDYRAERLRANASITDGVVGPSFLQWAWPLARAPARLQPMTPLHFAAQRVRWEPGRKLEASTEAQFAGGQHVSADFAWDPHTLDVRHLHIKDRLSDASVDLILRDRLLRAHFAGTLNDRSITAMLKDGGEHPGVIDGDLRMTLDLDRRERSSADGHLSARAVDLSWLLAKPISVTRAELQADGVTLHVRDAVVNWAQQMATIDGRIRFGAAGAVVDARVDSLGLMLDALLPPASSPSSTDPAASDDEPFAYLWRMPVSGQIEVRSDFIQYQSRRVAPVSATLTLEKQRLQLDLHAAKLCGISFPLTAEITPSGYKARARMVVRQQQLDETASCLSEQRLAISGAYDLRADLSTHGRAAELARNLQGTVEAEAHNGKVKQFALIGNILALKNVVGLFTKGPPHLGDTGFDYTKLTISGHFDTGRFIVEQAALDSPAMGLAATGSIGVIAPDTKLTVLVAPFERLDTLVRKVPIVGYVVGGSLTSLPVGVSGDIRNPTVVPLGPHAITSELTGIFERTLKLPAKLFVPSRTDPLSSNPH
jgi:uncharacterized protein involved in outer membrane biogenesis